jgi:hypothetical protein
MVILKLASLGLGLSDAHTAHLTFTGKGLRPCPFSFIWPVPREGKGPFMTGKTPAGKTQSEGNPLSSYMLYRHTERL